MISIKKLLKKLKLCENLHHISPLSPKLSYIVFFLFLHICIIGKVTIFFLYAAHSADRRHLET